MQLCAYVADRHGTILHQGEACLTKPTLKAGCGRAARRVFGVMLCCATVSQAATLQISPVSINFNPGDQAVGLTLRNPGETPIYGQVRVFRWDQVSDGDVLSPSHELIASPPLIQVGASADQLVRLVLTSTAPVAREQTYRLLIDELPQPGEPSESFEPAGKGVTIRLRYSVPVFIGPEGIAGTPALSFHLVRAGERWMLRVVNSGNSHGQISQVKLRSNAGRQIEVNRGLLGYALPGRTREWQVKLPADIDPRTITHIEASVNAQPINAVLEVH
jgi:fimbrial chaperone protein